MNRIKPIFPETGPQFLRVPSKVSEKDRPSVAGAASQAPCEVTLAGGRRESCGPPSPDGAAGRALPYVGEDF